GVRLTGQKIATFAEGIATGGAYEMTFDTLRGGLADFVLVSDDDIAVAMRALIDCTGNVPEAAGAVGFAGAKLLAPRLAGKHVAIIICGGNASAASLRRAL